MNQPYAQAIRVYLGIFHSHYTRFVESFLEYIVWFNPVTNTFNFLTDFKDLFELLYYCNNTLNHIIQFLNVYTSRKSHCCRKQSSFVSLRNLFSQTLASKKLNMLDKLFCNGGFNESSKSFINVKLNKLAVQR